MNFGLIIIGDEILSGRRVDKHLAKSIELLAARGIGVAYADYVGDDPARITALIQKALASGDIVFSFGGIGATPDDYTRQCAAVATGKSLTLHPQAKRLIEERMRDVAQEQGQPFEPAREDNLHRLQMGFFPQGCDIIPNPYNKIPGFSCNGALTPHGQGRVHFVPGFPVMAWPMVGWVLENQCSPYFNRQPNIEMAIIVMGTMEATLTPLMQALERDFPVKVFSLPSVDHPTYGKHIELGVKGSPDIAPQAFAALKLGLAKLGTQNGPETVRK